jgi:hypothetical protein
MDKKIIDTKNSDIEKFLIKTGFIFEMEMAEFLKAQSYDVEVNQNFLDLEENKKREIDIVATKKINNILVYLIVECKESLLDDWVFICSDKNPKRYYYGIKHSPEIKNLKKSKIFEYFHNYNKTIPLAQNYVVCRKKEKKSNNEQIDECLFKLPKALIYIASNASNDIKNIFFPIVLFNRKLFAVSYNNKIIVEEKGLIQYNVNFESKSYKPKTEPRYNSLLGGSYLNETYDPEKEELESIAQKAKSLKNYFQIDFVNKVNLKEYIKIIEEEIRKVSVKKWTFNINK